jgi:hypothetical protein
MMGASRTDFARRGKSANRCPAPFAKIFRFTSDPNHLYIYRQNGKLLLVERIMPERPSVSDEDREQAMSDLNMLRGPGGLERTEKSMAACLMTPDSSNWQSFLRAASA